MSNTTIYGLMAQFSTPDDVIDAATQAKKAGYHGQNTLEVVRSVLATEEPSQGPRIDDHLGFTVGINLLHRWGKDQVGSPIPEKSQVPIQIPWILIQILPRCELEGVHENGNCQEVRPLPGQVYEGKMTLMEVAHGRDEAQPEPSLPDRVQRFRQNLAGG